jgi:hypothetical protein
MRAEVMPTSDFHTLYLRWEVIPEGKERPMLEALGGPLVLELETSCFIDLGGTRHDAAKVKVPIWPHPGTRNLGQARFFDVDSRRRFWVNLLGAVGREVVDFLFEAKPGSVPKEGATIFVPERPKALAASERLKRHAAGAPPETASTP